MSAREKISLPLEKGEVVRRRQGGHRLFMHDRQIQRCQPGGHGGAAQVLRMVAVVAPAILAEVGAERCQVACSQSPAGVLHWWCGSFSHLVWLFQRL
jgi:hypothetical protein